MANRLTMAAVDTILTLHKTGHSNRAIAALLGVNRETVGRQLARAQAQIQPLAPPGNPGDESLPNQPPAPLPDDGGDGCADVSTQHQPPTSPDSGNSSPRGTRSECAEFREQILAQLELGLEGVRIHQDLVAAHGDSAPSYYSVRRFIARLRRQTPLPFRRIETAPAEEAQVDFGTGAAVRTAEGQVRRPWVFRIVLSYSRKGYSEAVWRQTAPSADLLRRLRDRRALCQQQLCLTDLPDNLLHTQSLLRHENTSSKREYLRFYRIAGGLFSRGKVRVSMVMTGTTESYSCVGVAASLTRSSHSHRPSNSADGNSRLGFG